VVKVMKSWTKRQTWLMVLALCTMGASCPTKPKPQPTPTLTPTPSPTLVVTPTPSPTPAPTPQLLAGSHRVCWGCIGSRAEDATGQGWIYPTTAKPLGFDAPLFFSQTCKHGSEEPIDDAVRRWAPFLGQAVAEDAHPVIELDWSDSTMSGGIESEVLIAPHVDVVFEVVAPWHDSILYWYAWDEAGYTRPMAETRIRYIRRKEAERGWTPKPIAAGFLEDELWRLDGHLAQDLQAVITEAGYAAGFGTGNRAEDARLIHDSLARQRPLIPADKDCWTWCADYNRNGRKPEYNADGGWAHSKEDLAALVFECRRTAREFGCDRVTASFCEVRGGSCPGGYCGGGWWDWRELYESQIKRANAYLATGVDPGPPVPTPAPTPVPTPGPETVEMYSSQVSYAPGTVEIGTATADPNQYLAVQRKNPSDQSITVNWHGECWTPGDDCSPISGHVVMGPGQTWAQIYATVPASPRNRYWHVTLDAPVPVLGCGNIWIQPSDPTPVWMYAGIYPANAGYEFGSGIVHGLGAEAVISLSIPSGQQCVAAIGGGLPWTVTLPADAIWTPIGGHVRDATGQALWLGVAQDAPAGCEIEMCLSSGSCLTYVVQ
jgi:hypothetical protein